MRLVNLLNLLYVMFAVVPDAKGSLEVQSFMEEPLIQSSYVHGVLLHNLVPKICDFSTLEAILTEPGLPARAARVLEVTKRLGIPIEKVFSSPIYQNSRTPGHLARILILWAVLLAQEFVSPQLLAHGGPTSGRLTLAYSAIIFSMVNGLEPAEKLNKVRLLHQFAVNQIIMFHSLNSSVWLY